MTWPTSRSISLNRFIARRRNELKRTETTTKKCSYPTGFTSEFYQIFNINSLQDLQNRKWNTSHLVLWDQNYPQLIYLYIYWHHNKGSLFFFHKCNSEILNTILELDPVACGIQAVRFYSRNKKIIFNSVLPASLIDRYTCWEEGFLEATSRWCAFQLTSVAKRQASTSAWASQEKPSLECA